jgi:sigma-B regulation protein RsbU (phosphoserine phosphatase)
MLLPLRILIVEDSESDAKLAEYELRRGGFDVQALIVSTAAEFAAALGTTLWDVILCDHSLPTFDSAAALRIAKARQPETPFIIVSGSLPEAAAAQAMLLGAQDYLSKDNLARLVPAVKRELQDATERRARRQAEQALSAQAEEMRIGREIQQRLFPAAAPALPGFDIAGASFPAAATGGDYFDYIPMLENRLGIVVGDVTGHGLGSALIMADARAILRTLARSMADVRELLIHANDLLREDIGWDRFLTVFFGRLCPVRRELTFLNAGHPHGVVLDREGAVQAELKATLPALGLFPLENVPEPATVTLAPGQLLLLLTDGVLEATAPSGEEFGGDRALAVVREQRARPATEIVAALIAAVRAFIQNQPQNDDITMVVVKSSD